MDKNSKELVRKTETYHKEEKEMIEDSLSWVWYYLTSGNLQKLDILLAQNKFFAGEFRPWGKGWSTEQINGTWKQEELVNQLRTELTEAESTLGDQKELVIQTREKLLEAEFALELRSNNFEKRILNETKEHCKMIGADEEKFRDHMVNLACRPGRLGYVDKQLHEMDRIWLKRERWT